jgi:Zn-finger nucleic acid-binding protein
MLCPTCKVELKLADRQGIEIDYCPQCRGVWLDRGELDKIVERSLTAAPVGRLTAPTYADQERAAARGWGDDYRPDDYCPDDYRQGDDRQARARGYRDDDDDDYDRRTGRRRRRGWLGELLDFD